MQSGRINLNADRSLTSTYGPLGYLSEDERKRILAIDNPMQRQREVERVAKEVADAKKKIKQRR